MKKFYLLPVILLVIHLFSFSLSACSGMPAWIASPYSKYDNQNYIALTGSGKSYNEARNSSLSNLVGYFGQSIQVDQKVLSTYLESVKNGITKEWTESTLLEENIIISASNIIIGAEVPDFWFDNKGTWYAVAVMDKENTKRIYPDIIKANQDMISNLLKMNQVEKFSIEGFSRYRFAAITADINKSLGTILALIGAPFPTRLNDGSEYQREADVIIKSIPIIIVFEKQTYIDGAENIRNAFISALSEIGFQTTQDNAPYTLEVILGIREEYYPNQQSEFVTNEINAKWVRYEISANLTDTTSRIGFLPVFSINGREGHSTLQLAEYRAITAAVNEIAEQYKDWLLEQLDQRFSKL